MPGYGTLPPDEGTGLLPWSWALKRLRESRDYWLSTVWPDGRPHLTPVWAVWHDDALWFSASRHARKIRNIRASSAVCLATDDPLNPVVIEGTARIMTDSTSLREFLSNMNDKYRTGCTIDFLDPARTATVRVRPRWAFALRESDFLGSPTRWEFR